MVELSIVIFAYNEAENIAHVLSEADVWAAKQVFAVEFIVVDDGSTDGTSSMVSGLELKTPTTLVQHEHNRGIGAALKSGVASARGTWVTFMPADGQIDPTSIDVLVASQRQGAFDFVTSIYADRDDGVHRKILSWGVRALITLIHQVRLQSDGPYLFRKDDFDPVRLKPDSFFLNFEFPIRLLSEGKRCGVVTITCRQRRSGHSKSAGLRTILIVGRELLELRLRRGLWG